MTPSDTKQKPVVGLAKNERCRAVEKRSRKSLSSSVFHPPRSYLNSSLSGLCSDGVWLTTWPHP